MIVRRCVVLVWVVAFSLGFVIDFMFVWLDYVCECVAFVICMSFLWFVWLLVVFGLQVVCCLGIVENCLCDFA